MPAIVHQRAIKTHAESVAHAPPRAKALPAVIVNRPHPWITFSTARISGLRRRQSRYARAAGDATGAGK
jgi:hypothetical protein